MGRKEISIIVGVSIIAFMHTAVTQGVVKAVLGIGAIYATAFVFIVTLLSVGWLLCFLVALVAERNLKVAWSEMNPKEFLKEMFNNEVNKKGD